MITLYVSCSMCGRELPSGDIHIEKTGHLSLDSFKHQVEQHGWIVQVNGESIDTYCSKKCAE